MQEFLSPFNAALSWNKQCVDYALSHCSESFEILCKRDANFYSCPAQLSIILEQETERRMQTYSLDAVISQGAHYPLGTRAGTTQDVSCRSQGLHFRNRGPAADNYCHSVCQLLSSTGRNLLEQIAIQLKTPLGRMSSNSKCI